MTAEPPLYERVIDAKGIATSAWTLFFQSVSNGDSGTDWTPTIVSLTGSATLTGRYYKISKDIVFFRAVVTPDTTTSSTAGTTYIDNFPLNMAADGFVLGVAGDAGLGTGLGVAASGSGRIYTPAWTSASVPVTLIGMVEAS